MTHWLMEGEYEAVSVPNAVLRCPLCGSSKIAHSVDLQLDALLLTCPGCNRGRIVTRALVEDKGILSAMYFAWTDPNAKDVPQAKCAQEPSPLRPEEIPTL